MDRHNYKQHAYYLIYLVRCVLNGKVPAKEKLDKMDLNWLINIANAHSLSAIAAYALESAGAYDKAFEEAKYMAIRRNIILDTERARVLEKLNENGIWYMPLKGIILKDYYPQIGMRQMCDNDILFDINAREKVEPIMSALGFKTESFGKGNHDVYFKEPVCNFERHVSLFSLTSYKTLYSVFENKNVVPKLLKSDENSSERKFNVNDLYVYLTAHEYNHFSSGGTGLRSLVDTYLFVKRHIDEFDEAYIARQFDKIGIAEFEEKRRALALDLFEGRPLDKQEKEFLDYYIFSGTYGNLYNKVTNKVDDGGKLSYLFKRLFPSMNGIKKSYPFFYKHKILLPFLFIYRLGLMITTRRKLVINELKTLLKVKKS